MKDEAGGTVTVGVENNEYVTMYTESEDMAYSPATARKLAKKLRKAADKVDGGKAKAEASARMTWDEKVSATNTVSDGGIVVLRLTEAQAETIAVMVSLTCGDNYRYHAPRTSPAVEAHQIYDILKGLGFEWESIVARSDYYNATPSSEIRFVGVVQGAA